MASGQLIILKNDLTDSDLTGRMLKSPMWKDEVRNKVRALRFTGFDASTHQRPGELGQRCRCKMHGCIQPLALIGGDGGDGFFDLVGHITSCTSPTALHIKGLITSSINMLEQAFGIRLCHVDFLAHNGERLGDAENVIQVDFLRCLIGKGPYNTRHGPN